MDKGELKWLISELNDKNTVIRGYAQMALKCDHPNWTKRYITSIIQQIDKISAVTAATLITSAANLQPWKT